MAFFLLLALRFIWRKLPRTYFAKHSFLSPSYFIVDTSRHLERFFFYSINFSSSTATKNYYCYQLSCDYSFTEKSYYN